MSPARALIVREALLAWRHRGELLTPVAFIVLVALLFPLAVGPDTALLQRMAPGVIWVAALLATLLSLPRVIAEDLRDGSLDQLILSPAPLAWLMFIKVVMHWLATGLPLTLVSPLIGIAYGMDGASLRILIATLLLGTPSLSLIGAIAVSLTHGSRRGGMFLAVLVLPLYIPVLIFAAGALISPSAGNPPADDLMLLGAVLAAAASLAPFATAFAVKIGTANS